MAYTLTTTPHRLDTPRTPATLAVLIRAKRARIAALEGWASEATMQRERAELARMEAPITATCLPDDPCDMHDPCPGHAELARAELARLEEERV